MLLLVIVSLVVFGRFSSKDIMVIKRTLNVVDKLRHKLLQSIQKKLQLHQSNLRPVVVDLDLEARNDAYGKGTNLFIMKEGPTEARFARTFKIRMYLVKPSFFLSRHARHCG